MHFEFHLDDGVRSHFVQNHKDCSFDIAVDLNQSVFKDMVIVKDLVRSLGLKKVMRALLSEGEWYRIFGILKPDISQSVRKGNVPMIELPMKRNKAVIRRVSEEDSFVFEGELKNRNFEPLSYVYLPAEFVLMPPYN